MIFASVLVWIACNVLRHVLYGVLLSESVKFEASGEVRDCESERSCPIA